MWSERCHVMALLIRMTSKGLHLQTALLKQRWNLLQSSKSRPNGYAESSLFCSGICKGNPGAGRVHIIQSYKPNAVREGKVPTFPSHFLILTVGRSFISSTWSDWSHGPHGFLPCLPPVLPRTFKDRLCGQGASLEASEGNVKSSQIRPPAAAPAQGVHLTPRPGCRANFPVAAVGSVSFGFLLCSLCEDMKSLFLPARECKKCRQDFREQRPLSFPFGNEQALKERCWAWDITTVTAQVSGEGVCYELLQALCFSLFSNGQPPWGS